MDSNSSSDSEEVDRYDPAQDSQSEESDYGSDKEFETKKASSEKDVFTETIKEDNQKKIDATGLSPFTGTSLPYELSSLTWDRSHRTNTSNMYCYCANPKTRDSVMLHCVQCKQWFHVECCKSKIKNPPVFGDWAYIFKCCICNNDNEYFEQIVKNWTDIVRVAIYNLIFREKLKGSDKKFFQYKEQICAFIDRHWDQLCFGKSRTKTWENTIGSALSTKSNYFLSGNDVIGAPGYWSLRNEDDPSITKDSGTAKPFGAPPKAPKEKKRKTSKPPSGSAKGGKKKKTETGEKPAPNPEVKSNKKKAIPLPVLLPKMPFHPKTYKYEDICLAKENSAPQIKISTDRMTASNDKGYRMARASFGVTEGAWYFEVKVQPHSGNTRLGWSTEKGDVQAPVGYDKYSYSYRDKEGTKFHQSRGTPYGLSYGPGDVIGFYIYLPPKPKEEKKEEAPKTPSKVEEPKVLPGSSITFFKNGVSQGVAFKDIFEGTYYPAASLYMGGIVKFNFGPHFHFPPNLDCKPVCEVIEVVLQEPDPNAAIMASYMNPEPATPVTPSGETSSQASSEVKAEAPVVPSTLETNMQT